jgi:hypothetical protein
VKTALLSLALALPALAAAPPAPKKGSDLVVVLVDDSGAAMVRWMLPEGPLPKNGFRLERSLDRGPRQVVATLKPGEVAPAGSRADVVKMTREYVALSADPQASTDAQKKRRLEIASFAVQVLAVGDPEAARLLGLSYIDRQVPKGATAVYTVVALGGDSKGESIHGVSQPTPVKPMPLPRPPADLRAKGARDGALLFWNPSREDDGKPWQSVTYEVLRREKPGGPVTRASERPVLLGKTDGSDGRDGERPAFRDNAAPTESKLLYSVASFDLLGRRGPESTPVEVFVPDFTANDPPAKVSAVPGPGKVTLNWDLKKNPNTLGYLVARSLGSDGPYFPLTPAPVAGPSFVDTTGKAGTSYYYTITAVNRRSEPGAPSPPATAPYLGAKPPDPPAGLTAERKTGLIVLRWKEADASSLQGYRVERDAGDGQWAILTSVPTPDDRFEDQLPADTLGTMAYRVVAVGLDGQVSGPSAVLKVPLPKTRPPARPEITSIDGAGGRVALEFRAGGERNEANGFLVLRSTSAADDGIVIHDVPLPKTATTFTDPDVTAGNDYLYRVVTLDDAGNRSDPSEAARVRVGSKRLEALPAPKLSYLAKPYPRVVADFAPPADPSARAVLERQEPDGSWRTLTGAIPHETTRAIDSHPPKGRKVLYRLSVVSANGVPGPASPPAEIQVP